MRFLQLTWNKWQYLQAWCNQKDQNQQRKLKQKQKISMQKLIWEVVSCRSCQKRKKPSWLQRVVSRSFRNIITKRTKKSQQSQNQMKRRKRQKSNQSQLSQNNQRKKKRKSINILKKLRSQLPKWRLRASLSPKFMSLKEKSRMRRRK